MAKRTKDWPTHNIVREGEVPEGVEYARAEFKEGVSIDYKWFDLHDIKPRYEFGFGLR